MTKEACYRIPNFVALSRDGLYRICRHPNYLGEMVFCTWPSSLYRDIFECAYDKHVLFMFSRYKNQSHIYTSRLGLKVTDREIIIRCLVTHTAWCKMWRLYLLTCTQLACASAGTGSFLCSLGSLVSPLQYSAASVGLAGLVAIMMQATNSLEKKQVCLLTFIQVSACHFSVLYLSDVCMMWSYLFRRHGMHLLLFSYVRLHILSTCCCSCVLHWLCDS